MTNMRYISLMVQKFRLKVFFLSNRQSTVTYKHVKNRCPQITFRVYKKSTANGTCKVTCYEVHQNKVKFKISTQHVKACRRTMQKNSYFWCSQILEIHFMRSHVTILPDRAYRNCESEQLQCGDP